MAIIFVETQLGRRFETLQDPRPRLKWGEPTVHVDRKQNINKFCFFKNVLTKQSDMFYQTDFFLCQINAIAKKQQFSSAKVSSIFRKRRHITFS